MGYNKTHQVENETGGDGMKTENAYYLERAMKGFDELDLPEHMRSAVELYLTHGILPGGFLTAVLENKLIEAAVKADHINIQRLRDWADFVYNWLPATCWGSETFVKAWSRKQMHTGVA